MLKILIADDHPILRAGIRVVLERQPGWQICAEAEDGEAAVRLARLHEPAVVIIDYSLPVLNGLEAIRHIHKALPKARVLIYTMHDDDMLIRDALKEGVRGYVLKTEDNERLIAGVRAIAQGQTFFSPRASKYPLGEAPAGSSDAASPMLTARERQVVQLVAEGKSNKTIATQWGLSIKTVDTHRTSAMRKLNLRTAVDLARYAIRNKLIEP